MNVIYILLYIMFCVGSEMNNFVVSVIILSCQFPKLTFKSISEDGIVTKCPDHLIGSNVSLPILGVSGQKMYLMTIAIMNL